MISQKNWPGGQWDQGCGLVLHVQEEVYQLTYVHTYVKLWWKQVLCIKTWDTLDELGKNHILTFPDVLGWDLWEFSFRLDCCWLRMNVSKKNELINIGCQEHLYLLIKLMSGVNLMCFCKFDELEKVAPHASQVSPPVWGSSPLDSGHLFNAMCFLQFERSENCFLQKRQVLSSGSGGSPSSIVILKSNTLWKSKTIVTNKIIIWHFLHFYFRNLSVRRTDTVNNQMSVSAILISVLSWCSLFVIRLKSIIS